MYTRIRIQHFRGLRDLTIDDLGRVNLIVGANNAGKTSLLEALWLSQGQATPNMTMALNALRGLDPPIRTPELLWHSLFYNWDRATHAVIEAWEGSGEKQRLEIAAEYVASQPVQSDAGTASVGVALPGIDSSLTRAESLVYRYRMPDGTELVREVDAAMGIEQVKVATGEVRAKPAAFLAVRRWVALTEMARIFTQISDLGQQPLVEQSLKILEPRLRGLSQAFQDGRPLIRANIGLDRPIPLQVLGDGAVRLLELLLTLFAYAGGMQLVDEIEDGLYARSLEDVWRALDAASKIANCQIFATTHSWECIQAAVTAFKGERASDFRLHRLDLTEGGVHAVTYEHEVAEAALNANLEVR